MKFATAVALVAFAGSALAQQLTINTPTNVVQCQPVLLTWTGGSPPYFLSILPGNQPSAAALETFPQQSGNSVTWNVDIAQGTSIGLTLRDSKGITAQTAAFSVNPSSDSSCVGKGQSSASGASTGSGASSGAASSSTATGGAGTSPATTPATGGTTTAAAGASTTPRSSASASSSPATTTKPNSGAAANAVSLGAVGAAVLALLF